jgi:hypothetical protein
VPISDGTLGFSLPRDSTKLEATRINRTRFGPRNHCQKLSSNTVPTRLGMDRSLDTCIWQVACDNRARL